MPNVLDSVFQVELEHLLNKHSIENASNTPDFILAQYLCACLAAWDRAVQQRETWCSRDVRPSEADAFPPPWAGSGDVVTNRSGGFLVTPE